MGQNIGKRKFSSHSKSRNRCQIRPRIFPQEIGEQSDELLLASIPIVDHSLWHRIYSSRPSTRNPSPRGWSAPAISSTAAMTRARATLADRSAPTALSTASCPGAVAAALPASPASTPTWPTYAAGSYASSLRIPAPNADIRTRGTCNFDIYADGRCGGTLRKCSTGGKALYDSFPPKSLPARAKFGARRRRVARAALQKEKVT